MSRIINGETIYDNPATGESAVLRSGKWLRFRGAPPPAPTPAPLGPAIDYPGDPATPPSGPLSGLDTLFQQKLAQPVTRFTSRYVPSSIAKGVIPQNLTDLTTDAAMAGSMAFGNEAPAVEEGAAAAKGLFGRFGPKVGRALLRMGGVGGVSGATNLMTGKDFGSGFLSGAGQQGLGEVGAPILNKFGTLGKETLNDYDTKTVAGYLKTLGSWLPVPKDAGGFDRAFRGSGASSIIGKRLGILNQRISKIVGDDPLVRVPVRAEPPSNMVQLPSGNIVNKAPQTPYYLMNFEQALKELGKLRDAASYSGPDGNLREAARQARLQSHEIVNDLKTTLNKRQPGLGTAFGDLRRQYAGSELLSAIFREPKVIQDGRINFQELQKLVALDYRKDLERVFGKGHSTQFLRKVFHGARDFSATDIQGKGLGGLLGESVRVFYHSSGPSLYGHVPFGLESLGRRVGVPSPRKLIPGTQMPFPRVPPGGVALPVSAFINSLLGNADDDTNQ